MANELNLSFPSPTEVMITLNGSVATRALPFAIPLTDADYADIRWYVETYGAHSIGDPDDTEALRIAQQLSIWGRALFNSVFNDTSALRRYFAFLQVERHGRLLTVAADDPSILALPWELLHDPSRNGGFLFLENPRISIRRRVLGSDDGRLPFPSVAKERIRLLFVVSRPGDAAFIDPRADSQSVLEAVERHAPGRVTCEFLLPPTLDALLDRLEDGSKPPVDILHFDGHGVFDRRGDLRRHASPLMGDRMTFEEIAVLKDTRESTSPSSIGYLLFEDADGQADFVSAAKLGANLHRHDVPLVVLSACQSAALPGPDATAPQGKTSGAMASVAARLTGTGIPSVIAMTHSVLVHTTRALFGEFYKELARVKGVGESLDNARRYLANHPQKYDVQRGASRVPLLLYDWFVPALYQQGDDGPLLTPSTSTHPALDTPRVRTNVPPTPEGGFFGRRRDLWHIERWFAASTRRITITGFGGQGKTALAHEAGRWLLRTGQFQAAVVVDFSRIQAADAIAVATSTIGNVLAETLVDRDAAAAALTRTPTLLILDNLEILGQEALHALLEAAAIWSNAGSSRVLCTSRHPTFNHPQYRVEGTAIHRRIVLDGLGSHYDPDDALEWVAELLKLPPAPVLPVPRREALITLFDRVRFHPLSVRVLTQQLKRRSAADVTARLEQLLAFPHADAHEDDTPATLLASLELSLDQLDAAARTLVLKLGVIEGGALESRAQAVVELQKEDAVWNSLRQQLEDAGLVTTQPVPGVDEPFLRFHPTLASMLWSQLSASDRARAEETHRHTYYHLSTFLHAADGRNPDETRTMAWLELPNLVRAAYADLDAGHPGAIDLADDVRRFLSMSGLHKAAEQLTLRAQAAAGDVGSEPWLIAQTALGEQLLDSGRVSEAIGVFQAALERLRDQPMSDRITLLVRLGRCAEVEANGSLAEMYARQALHTFTEHEQDEATELQRASVLSGLGDALAMQGSYAEARRAYEDALGIAERFNDLSHQGPPLLQLGTLALRARAEGWDAEAVQRYQAAITIFERLRQPDSVATATHQLGRVFEETAQWDEAERCFRRAATIREELGNRHAAASTWNQLALVNMNAHRPTVAEDWFRKAINAARESNDAAHLAGRLNNLAGLLVTIPGRVPEARVLVTEALAIAQTLDPATTPVWQFYTTLAKVNEAEARSTRDARLAAEFREHARQHRDMARDTRFGFSGTRERLREHGETIHTTIAAISDPANQLALERHLVRLAKDQWSDLVASIRAIVHGQRDPDLLCETLDVEDSMIVMAILNGLKDRSSVADLFPEASA
ncbi:MAG TPA: CHAT domain-containing protein [Thermoanaerobaculia bacterium]|nr:CHAT domain-containing protein [Thermoanaerobaculia bacterium]